VKPPKIWAAFLACCLGAGLVLWLLEGAAPMRVPSEPLPVEVVAPEEAPGPARVEVLPQAPPDQKTPPEADRNLYFRMQRKKKAP
jgi:hypothetical protein